MKIWQDRCVECTKSTCSTDLQQCTLNQMAKQIFGNGHNCNMYKIKPFHQIFSFDTCSTSVFQENNYLFVDRRSALGFNFVLIAEDQSSTLKLSSLPKFSLTI